MDGRRPLPIHFQGGECGWARKRRWARPTAGAARLASSRPRWSSAWKCARMKKGRLRRRGSTRPPAAPGVGAFRGFGAPALARSEKKGRRSPVSARALSLERPALFGSRDETARAAFRPSATAGGRVHFERRASAGAPGPSPPRAGAITVTPPSRNHRRCSLVVRRIRSGVEVSPSSALSARTGAANDEATRAPRTSAAEKGIRHAGGRRQAEERPTRVSRRSGRPCTAASG